MHEAEGPVHIHSVQIVNCVFNLFYLLFVCILIFIIYPKQLFPLQGSLTFYIFIVFFFPFYFIDNVDVTINKRASILQTLGSPSDLGTLFVDRGGGSRRSFT